MNCTPGNDLFRNAVSLIGALLLAASCGDTSTGNNAQPDMSTAAVDSAVGAGPDLAGCTGNETFAAARTAMLSGCTAVQCHGSAPFAGGLDLRASNAYKSLVGVDSNNAPGKPRVAPGDPEGSFLYQKLTNTQGQDEGAPMPSSINWSAPDEQKLNVLRCWILKGAAND